LLHPVIARLAFGLFLEHHRALRDLPSFPTRRSSDLAHDAHAQPRVALEATGGYERALADVLLDAALHVAVVQPGCVRHFAKSLKDRKSTRLNSSHVKISYAVFCLKKKI